MKKTGSQKSRVRVPLSHKVLVWKNQDNFFMFKLNCFKFKGNSNNWKGADLHSVLMWFGSSPSIECRSNAYPKPCFHIGSRSKTQSIPMEKIYLIDISIRPAPDSLYELVVILKQHQNLFPKTGNLKIDTIKGTVPGTTIARQGCSVTPNIFLRSLKTPKSFSTKLLPTYKYRYGTYLFLL